MVNKFCIFNNLTMEARLNPAARSDFLITFQLNFLALQTSLQTSLEVEINSFLEKL